MNNLRKRGLLITSAESEKDLPKYFVKQFEVIDLEAMKQSISDSTSTSTPKDTPEPQAQDTSKDIKEIYYDDKEGKLFVDKFPAKLTPTEKVFFEYFWDHKSGNITVDEIIDYMTTFNESNNTTWDRRYFDKTLSSINTKCKSLWVENLIRNVEHGKGEYVISIKVKKKIFKP
jgi:DNA-binding response OmpR family regulator